MLAENEDSRSARRTKKATEPETFLPRVDSPWKVGAHVSAAGGVENAVTKAASIGATAFALFLKSQRKWTSPVLSEESITSFKEKMIEHKYSPDVVLPHGSYLINLGNPDQEKREKSYECFIDDLKRCESLGLKYYNFHPGSTVGTATKEESISLIAECINRAHRETDSVVTVIENMAGAGNVIGGDFSDLKGIIDGVVDKSRVGVCLDTCHSFAAGYDLRTKEAWESVIPLYILQYIADYVNKFDEEVGLSYLCGMHLNDSKVELGSHKDRHENIGLGHLGLSAFRNLMNDARVQNIPLILETPSFEAPAELWAKEIAVLQSLSTITAESKENQKALHSIIGDDRTDEALVDVIRNAVTALNGIKANKSGAKKAKKGGKRKRNEDEDEDGDEEE
ncbi:putative endonuclease 4 [Leucoagaricus sp. SymC.cos]|nr:putative endonuclease 4 [Leucoagaricus sp. SymC.cos]